MATYDDDDDDSVEVIDLEESFDDESVDENSTVSEFESAPEEESELNPNNDESSSDELDNLDEDSHEESDGLEIDETSVDVSSGSFDEETAEEIEMVDEEIVLLNAESDASDEESMDEAKEDTEVYGKQVGTDPNPRFSNILELATSNQASTVHVTDPKGKSLVYMLNETESRRKLKVLLQKKKKGYSWIVRNKKPLELKGNSNEGFAEGFDPHPSSEEDESENEIYREEEEDIASKEGKKPRGKKKPSMEKKMLKSKKMSKGNTKTRENASESRRDINGTGGTKTKKGKQSSKGDNASGAGEEDDDSVDFGDPNIKENLHKQIQKKEKSLLPVYVSAPFHDTISGTVVYAVFFGKPGNSFMLKAVHQQAIMRLCHMKRLIGNSKNIPKWIDTIADLKVCKVEHGEPSVWYRTSKGNTTEIIYFVLTVPEDESDTVHDILDDIIKNFFIKGFKARKKNPAGELALAYAESLSDNSQVTKGLYNWCVNAKGKGDPSVAARVMTKEIDDHFSGGPSFHYDVSLDKFMVEWDIKQFLNDRVGINSWEELNEVDRKVCFRNYPKRELPEWATIMPENY